MSDDPIYAKVTGQAFFNERRAELRSILHRDVTDNEVLTAIVAEQEDRIRTLEQVLDRLKAK